MCVFFLGYRCSAVFAPGIEAFFICSNIFPGFAFWSFYVASTSFSIGWICHILIHSPSFSRVVHFNFMVYCSAELWAGTFKLGNISLLQLMKIDHNILDLRMLSQFWCSTLQKKAAAHSYAFSSFLCTWEPHVLSPTVPAVLCDRVVAALPLAEPGCVPDSPDSSAQMALVSSSTVNMDATATPAQHIGKVVYNSYPDSLPRQRNIKNRLEFRNPWFFFAFPIPKFK